MRAPQSGYALKRKRSSGADSVSDERTLETRSAIITAAREVLLEKGYAATRVEDIITRAGISRPTFYRHFKDKFEVAKAYHALSGDETLGPWGALSDVDMSDVAAIRRWFEALLNAFAERCDELAVWSEMSAIEPNYLMRVPRQIPALIELLGRKIPAFARAQSQAPEGEGEPGPVWVEAYLLLEHLSYYCTWLALGKHVISKKQSVDYFCERLYRFAQRYGG
ncbi:MAG: TetR/AcrR family transcriptional regulator [Alphaproteobacteria bacterium]|nr:TetR/AcrR family transcriptional regulator [Alphaproteobacteria bacterium]